LTRSLARTYSDMLPQFDADRQGEIKIDKEGNWFFNGAPIINRQIIDLFNAGIEHDGQGGYRLRVGAETSPIVVEDTPYVVSQINLEQGPDGRSFFTVRLNDDTIERLSLETFYLGPDNVPYCTVKNGLFPARFLRAPYYDLARHIDQEGEERFCIILNGKKQYIEKRESKSR
jgi:uncharacterized protein